MRRVLLGLAIAVSSLLPAWALAGDLETAQKVAGNMKYSGRLKNYAIDVKAKDGVVVLVGKVASDEQAQAAIEVAQQTPGVDRVVPQLSIAQTALAPASAVPSPRSLQQPAAQQAGVIPQPPVFDEESAVSTRRTATSVATKAAPEFPAYDPGQMPAAANYHEASQIPNPVSRDLGQLPTPARYESATKDNGNRPSVAANTSRINPAMNQPRPLPQVPYTTVAAQQAAAGMQGEPIPAYAPGTGGGVAPAHFDHAQMPGYAWPSYAAYPNYAAVTYPKQYSPTAWPFIGPFYPYPQVPLGWRKVTLEWDDGWWFLDFDDRCCHHR